MSVRPGSLPPEALLQAYADTDGCYTDCYVAETEGAVTLPAYVAAFYTTRLFKLERFILKWTISRPSTDREAAQVAAGQIDRFAAWTVEGRADDQLLMCDIAGRTRSWFMIEPGAGRGTRLYFGSAVVPVADRKTGKRRLGFGFNALLGFHKLYSRALLSAARARLAREKAGQTARPSQP